MPISRLHSTSRCLNGNAKVPWYLSGGIAKSNVVCAYQPKGAATQASSYINLANPGTYNASSAAPPTWSAANGWILNGSSQFLDTGVTPLNGAGTWSAIARYSGANLTSDRCISGIWQTANWSMWTSWLSTTYKRFYEIPGGSTGGARAASGVIAVAGRYGYHDGIVETAQLATGSNPGAYTMYIGKLNRASGGLYWWVGNIQAYAIYNIALSAAQVALVTTEMNSI